MKVLQGTVYMRIYCLKILYTICHFRCMPVLKFIAKNLFAVSYTHLDVYKRQSLPKAVIEVISVYAISLALDAPLYTRFSPYRVSKHTAKA